MVLRTATLYHSTSISWLNLAQWKGATWDRTKNDPIFILGLGDFQSGAMRLRLTWSPRAEDRRASPGQRADRLGTLRIEVPVGRWFPRRGTTRIYAADFHRRSGVGQDGVEILNLEGVRTRYDNGDCQSSTNDYGEYVAPSPCGRSSTTSPSRGPGLPSGHTRNRTVGSELR